ncbi:hypothetical protein ACWCWD_01060 [Streptomyces sp. NPDC001493]
MRDCARLARQLLLDHRDMARISMTLVPFITELLPARRSRAGRLPCRRSARPHRGRGGRRHLHLHQGLRP